MGFVGYFGQRLFRIIDQKEREREREEMEMEEMEGEGCREGEMGRWIVKDRENGKRAKREPKKKKTIR